MSRWRSSSESPHNKKKKTSGDSGFSKTPLARKPAIFLQGGSVATERPFREVVTIPPEKAPRHLRGQLKSAAQITEFSWRRIVSWLLRRVVANPAAHKLHPIGESSVPVKSLKT
ncbi:hypothetical protein MTO96_022322 [Rhipicephalus appendiculatus]